MTQLKQVKELAALQAAMEDATGTGKMIATTAFHKAAKRLDFTALAEELKELEMFRVSESGMHTGEPQ